MAMTATRAAHVLLSTVVERCRRANGVSEALTRYGIAFYGAPISIYGLDNTIIDQDTKENRQRKVGKKRMGKGDLEPK